MSVGFHHAVQYFGNTYLVFNATACAVYLLVFVLVLRRVTKHAKDSQNLTALFVVCLAPLFSAMYLMNALGGLLGFGQEVCPAYLVAALVPIVLLFVFRRKIFDFEASSASAVAKFDKLKDEFVTVASHELRTPLSIINGFAEILVRERVGSLNDEQKRRVRKILMQAQRLNRILDNLLDLSRIRSGKIEVRRDVFDLVPVLKSCLDDHHIVSYQQRIELCDEIGDVLPDVVGDLERTTQVVVNLLSNALKYTHPGGKVIFRSYHDRSGREVRVEIQDSGIGISEEDQRLVFKEFYRASDEHARKYAGSGLGLAIAKQLVESQGGRMGVSSLGQGKGSLFYFTLPVALPSAGRANAAATPKWRKAG
jgi:signal transduction histidine kinase